MTAIDRRALFARTAAWGLGLLAAERARGRRATEDLPPRGVAAYSESVYADAVSEDGSTGFIVRLCRYPEAGVAWCWGHAFRDGELFAFTDHAVPCDPAVSDLDAAEVAYRAERPGYSIALRRVGPSSRPVRCTARSRFAAHPFPRSAGAQAPPPGDGPVAMHIEAIFAPAHDPVSSLAGRTEVLGTVSAELQIGERTTALACRGHFDEQQQDRPRWTAPFCYATLRGPDYHSVAILLEQGAVGFVERGGQIDRVVGFAIEPPSDGPGERHFEMRLDAAEPVRGVYRDTHVYAVPVYDLG